MIDPYHPSCIITGCSLIRDNDPECHINGDLFEMGDHYIFNGNVETLGAAEFIYAKTVTVGHYFERRHVFVFHKTSATFNEAAARYIA